MNPDLDEFKALGIDYGEKRIGIALSELNGKFAIPHSILQYKNIEFALNEIKKIFPDAIITGNKTPPRTGAFEITLNSKLIYSKFQTDIFPSKEKIKELLTA